MTDDNTAISGFDAGYVPCPDLVAAEPTVDDSGTAVSGYDAGYVPVGDAAATEPATDDNGWALAGFSAAYVANPCAAAGCTDDFNRPDDPTGLGTATPSGLVWSTTSGSPEIIGNQGAYPAMGGAIAGLGEPMAGWPLPFNGVITLDGVSIPVQFHYVEASGWGPSWSSSLGTASVDGTSGFEDGGSSMTTNVPTIADGTFEIDLVLTPDTVTGTPVIDWIAGASSFQFIIHAEPGTFTLQTSPGGPSDPGGPTFTTYGSAGAWFYVRYQAFMAVSPFNFVVTSAPVQFDTYAHFLANGVTGTVVGTLTQADTATMTFQSGSSTVGPSVWGIPAGYSSGSDPVAPGQMVVPGTSVALQPATAFDTNITRVLPAVTDYGWYWTLHDPINGLTFTAAYISTGATPLGGLGMWDTTQPYAFDVPTPLIYVQIDDGVTYVRGWSGLAADVTFPAEPLVTIDASEITLTLGGHTASVANATGGYPPTASVAGDLVHAILTGLGTSITFDDLCIT